VTSIESELLLRGRWKHRQIAPISPITSSIGFLCAAFCAVKS